MDRNKLISELKKEILDGILDMDTLEVVSYNGGLALRDTPNSTPIPISNYPIVSGYVPAEGDNVMVMKKNGIQTIIAGIIPGGSPS